MVVCCAALIVGGVAWMSITGSGPCVPPACENPEDECQLTCNGALEGTCIGTATLECVKIGPCDPANACPPPPDCHTAKCFPLTQCGSEPGVYTCDGTVCCRNDPWPEGAGCPLSGEDPDDPSEWSGLCDAAHNCSP